MLYVKKPEAESTYKLVALRAVTHTDSVTNKMTRQGGETRAHTQPRGPPLSCGAVTSVPDLVVVLRQDASLST